MGEQHIIHVPVDKVTYDLYYSKYYEAKRMDPKTTHRSFVRKLLGM